MATAGELVVNILANVGPFQQGMKTAGNELSKFEVAAKNTDAIMGKFGSTLGRWAANAATAVAGFFALGKATQALGESLTRLDQMVDLSTRTGIAVESLQKLGYAAQLSGGSADSRGRSFQRQLPGGKWLTGMSLSPCRT